MRAEGTINTDEAIRAGIDAQKSGNLALAEECYRAVLASNPDNAAVNYLQSMVSLKSKGGERQLESDLLGPIFSRYQSHYSAVPPYNLNWIIRDTAPVDDFLVNNPIVVYDIGARGSDLGEIVGLKKHIKYYGFDADAAECERLNASPPAGFHEFRLFPIFLGRDSDWVCFHLYKAAACSSRFQPGKNFKSRFSPGLEIERTVALKSECLDQITDLYKIDPPDLLKLDTQGTELEIMRGGLNALTTSLMVEVEVEFTEMYEGQPLFHDVDRFMHENGFELLYLNRFFQNRYRYPGEARGQLTFGDALYGRVDRLELFPAVRLAKYAILLINYGHVDIAFDIFLDHPEVKAVASGLAGYFKAFENNESRLECMNLDKLICWLLHKRRTNKLPMDSDRSWPVR